MKLHQQVTCPYFLLVGRERNIFENIPPKFGLFVGNTCMYNTFTKFLWLETHCEMKNQNSEPENIQVHSLRSYY